VKFLNNLIEHLIYTHPIPSYFLLDHKFFCRTWNAKDHCLIHLMLATADCRNSCYSVYCITWIATNTALFLWC